MASWALVAFAAGLGSGLPALAEFYKYTDTSGRTYYVDEIWKIPEDYRGQAGRYREKFDHLSEDQRVQVIESDQERQRELESEQRRQNEKQLQDLAESQEEERRQRAEAEQQLRLKGMETQVTIANNQILVPVALTNGGIETTVQLIMDTGATHTVLYRPAATRLNIVSLAKGQAKVAGGQSVHSEVGKVDTMRVGPILVKDVAVVILAFEGPAASYSGLLGMDFLGRVDYNIDYDKQVIRWKLRAR